MQGDRHYDYDAYGNLIRERRGTGQKLITEYRYDCQHRLIGVSLPGGSTASYKYDAFGRRIEKTVDGHTTEFLWQGERLIAESAENRYRSYIYEPGSFRPLAMLDGEGPLKAAPFYYQLDHLGTPQELTDYSGEIMWSARYRAYGNLAALDVSEIDNPLRFQGQYFDAETGLHYNRHRYYNPGTGRFLTPDPIKLAGGLNSYQYVPNPTGWVEPLGLSSNNCPPKRVDISDYQTRKELRSDVYNAQRPGGFHKTKHLNAKSADQARELSLGNGSRGGQPEASYLPDIANNVKGFEKQAAYGAIKDGNVFDHGGTRFMFYRSEHPVGYNEGQLTNWIRIELTDGGNKPVIHSFPASPQQVKKYMGKAK